MKRIAFLTVVLVTVSSLALAEKNSSLSPQPNGYSVSVSGYKIVVLTPLDKSRAVLLGIFEKDNNQFKQQSSYLAEGAIALAVSKLAKIVSIPDHSPEVTKYVKEMVAARKTALESK